MLLPLEKIYQNKKQAILTLKTAETLLKLNKLATPTAKSFLKAISKPLSLIAEIKHASPSEGKFQLNYTPFELAKKYKASGASAISVVTDNEYFNGSVNDINDISELDIPILRKDFIVDEFEIYQSRIFGADAVLLIAKMLSDNDIKVMYEVAMSLNMHIVLEVHTEEELARAVKLGVKIIGINNRNLETLNVDIETTFKLLSKIPNRDNFVIISESGFSNREDIERLKQSGVNAVLIGTSLLKSKDPAEKIRDMGF